MSEPQMPKRIVASAEADHVSDGGDWWPYPGEDGWTAEAYARDSEAEIAANYVREDVVRAAADAAAGLILARLIEQDAIVDDLDSEDLSGVCAEIYHELLEALELSPRRESEDVDG